MTSRLKKSGFSEWSQESVDKLVELAHIVSPDKPMDAIRYIECKDTWLHDKVGRIDEAEGICEVLDTHNYSLGQKIHYIFDGNQRSFYIRTRTSEYVGKTGDPFRAVMRVMDLDLPQTNALELYEVLKSNPSDKKRENRRRLSPDEASKRVYEIVVQQARGDYEPTIFREHGRNYLKERVRCLGAAFKAIKGTYEPEEIGRRLYEADQFEMWRMANAGRLMEAHGVSYEVAREMLPFEYSSGGWIEQVFSVAVDSMKQMEEKAQCGTYRTTNSDKFDMSMGELLSAADQLGHKHGMNDNKIGGTSIDMIMAINAITRTYIEEPASEYGHCDLDPIHSYRGQGHTILQIVQCPRLMDNINAEKEKDLRELYSPKE